MAQAFIESSPKFEGEGFAPVGVGKWGFKRFPELFRRVVGWDPVVVLWEIGSAWHPNGVPFMSTGFRRSEEYVQRLPSVGKSISRTRQTRPTRQKNASLRRVRPEAPDTTDSG